MDTPGFDDTNVSDSQILMEIATALVDFFSDEAEIQGALYVHPVVEARMRGSGIKNLRMFRKVLGMEGMKNCRLVTTKWQLVDRDVGDAREKELCSSDQFWGPLIRAGATTVRFDDSTESAMDILRPLLFGASFEPQLVGEVLRDGKIIMQTEAGQVVIDDVEEAEKMHAEEIKQLEKERKDAEAQKDFEYAAQLEEERKKHQAEVKRLEKDKEILSQPVPQPVPKSSPGGPPSGIGRWLARASAITVGGAATYLSGGLLAPFAALLYGATEQALHDSRNTRRFPPRS